MRIGKYIRMANPNKNGPHTVYIPLTSWSYKDLRSSSFRQPSVMILYRLCIDKSSNSKRLSWGKSQELFWGSNFSQMFSSECLVLACRLCLPCQDNQVLASVRRRMSMLWVHTTLHIAALQCIVVFKLSSLQIQNRAFNEACICSSFRLASHRYIRTDHCFYNFKDL